MKTAKLGFAIAVFLWAVYAGRSASALCGPQQIECGCICLPGDWTENYVGTGSTCSAASTSAKSQGYAEATANCMPETVCRRTYNVVTPCYWDAAAQVYKEVGYVQYRCNICE